MNWINKNIGLVLVAILAFIGIYFFFIKPGKGKSGTLNANSGSVAVDASDEAASKQILAWVAANTPEYGWWIEDVKLYLPGGARDTIQFLGAPDLPNGGYTKTQRIIAAMNELQQIDPVKAFAFTSGIHSNLISKYI